MILKKIRFSEFLTFWTFGDFFFNELFDFFGDFFVFIGIFWGFLTFLDFFKNNFFGIFLKLLRLQLKVTEVTTEHQKWPKVSQKSIKSSFCRRQKKALAGGQTLRRS